MADSRGRVAFKADVYTDWLLENTDVRAGELLKETESADTVGNAWFSYSLHSRPAGWRAPLVVTSRFHASRTRAAFDWVWSLEPPAGRPRYLSSPDDGLSAATLAARKKREAASCAALRTTAAGVSTLSAFHAWLNATHLCYAVARQHEAPEPLADEERKSY